MKECLLDVEKHLTINGVVFRRKCSCALESACHPFGIDHSLLQIKLIHICKGRFWFLPFSKLYSSESWSDFVCSRATYPFTAISLNTSYGEFLPTAQIFPPLNGSLLIVGYFGGYYINTPNIIENYTTNSHPCSR